MGMGTLGRKNQVSHWGGGREKLTVPGVMVRNGVGKKESHWAEKTSFLFSQSSFFIAKFMRSFKSLFEILYKFKRFHFYFLRSNELRWELLELLLSKASSDFNLVIQE